jgi:hypothetical protein
MYSFVLITHHREILVVHNCTEKEAPMHHKALTTMGYMAQPAIANKYFLEYSSYARMMVQVTFAVNLAGIEGLDAFGVLHTQCDDVEKRRKQGPAWQENAWRHMKCKPEMFKTSGNAEEAGIYGAAAEEDLERTLVHVCASTCAYMYNCVFVYKCAFVFR